MSAILNTLPATVQARASQALYEAFPGAAIESLTPLHGGQSGSLVYKLVVDGQPFVIRMMQEVSMLHNPARQLGCMQIASERGITPPVHYTNQELAISIGAYVAHQPTNLRQNSEQVVQLGKLLSHLHSGPAFPAFIDGFELIQSGLEQLIQTGMQLPQLFQELLAVYEPIKLVLQPYLTLAPCHHDLNPGNLLYDGQRLWLIDWESACMGDPIYDLASLIHWFLLDSEQEAVLLNAYFQRDPHQQELAKLTLMKQVSWSAYATIFLLISQPANDSATITNDRQALPSFAEAVRAIGRGELKLQYAESRRLMSLVIAKQALTEIQQPEFQQALAYLSNVSRQG